MRLPSPQDIATLLAIRDLERFGWTCLDKFDARPCQQAGWIVAHDKGFRLTGTGRALLPSDLRRDERPFALADEQAEPGHTHSG